MKKCFTFFLATICSLALSAQGLSVSVTGTINTDCIGQGCFYNGPTILINEVMLSPTSYDGSMVGSAYHTSGEGEWIELYNPHKCDSVDISCYFLGNNAYDNTYQVGNWGGGFVIPPGTVVPPQGFAMIRGSRAPAVPAELLVQNGGNVVEVIINSNYCLGSGGGRLWFPNAGGWFAFYDANGVPQDAISWCSQTNCCMSCPPCNPMASECGYTGPLASYNEIPASRQNYITSLNPEYYLGQSFRRMPDGGAWQSSPAYPTYATCNDVCADPPVITCNATATATVSGGTPPYTYQWNDANLQTTSTAVGLCAGTYHVTVTDANLVTTIGEVTIVNYEPPVSHSNYVNCLSDSSVILSGLPLGGEYTGAYVDNNSEFFFNDSAAIYEMAYTISDTNGCTATADFTITVNPEYFPVFYDTICQHETYSGYGFTLTAAQTATAGDQTLTAPLQSISQCDSIVTLYLTVLPTDEVTIDTAICEGTDFDAYGFQFAASDLPVGLRQEQRIFTNIFGCDSTVNLNLEVHPVYDIVQNENLCRGNIYNSFGFLLDPDTMELGEHTFVHAGTSSLGCDSVFTLIINILPINETIFYDTICQYETYALHGFNLSQEENSVSGEYTYIHNLQNAYGCDSTVILHLAVPSNPPIDFVSNPERILLSEGGEIQFINLTDMSGVLPGETFTWQWDFGDGASENSTDMNMAHTYDTWGEFLVSLILHSSNGCESSVEHYVYVDADLIFPNVMTPNGDGVNDVFAIKNLNPELPNVLTIYNRWGKKVFEMENYQTYIKDDVLYNPETAFRGEDNSDGVYYYTFHYVGHVHAVDYHSSLTIIR